MMDKGKLLSLGLILSIGIFLLSLNSINKPNTELTQQPIQAIEVTTEPYTILYLGDFEYIKSYYIKDNRLYYTKQNGKKGSVSADDARLEQGYIAVEDLDEYGIYVVEGEN